MSKQIVESIMVSAVKSSADVPSSVVSQVYDLAVKSKDYPLAAIAIGHRNAPPALRDSLHTTKSVRVKAALVGLLDESVVSAYISKSPQPALLAAAAPRFFDRGWFWDALEAVPSSRYTKELVDVLSSTVPAQCFTFYVIDSMFSVSVSLPYQVVRQLEDLSKALTGPVAAKVCSKVIDGYYSTSNPVYYASPYKLGKTNIGSFVELLGCYVEFADQPLKQRVVSVLADLITADSLPARFHYQYEVSGRWVSSRVPQAVLKLFAGLAPASTYRTVYPDAWEVIDKLTVKDPTMSTYHYTTQVWCQPTVLASLRTTANTRKLKVAELDFSSASPSEVFDNVDLFKSSSSAAGQLLKNPALDQIVKLLPDQKLTADSFSLMYHTLISAGLLPDLPSRGPGVIYDVYDVVCDTSGVTFDRYRSWVLSSSSVFPWIADRMLSSLNKSCAAYSDEQFRQLYVGVLKAQVEHRTLSPASLWFLQQTAGAVEVLDMCESLLQSCSDDTTLGTLLDTANTILARV